MSTKTEESTDPRENKYSVMLNGEMILLIRARYLQYTEDEVALFYDANDHLTHIVKKYDSIALEEKC